MVFVAQSSCSAAGPGLLHPCPRGARICVCCTPVLSWALNSLTGLPGLRPFSCFNWDLGLCVFCFLFLIILFCFLFGLVWFVCLFLGCFCFFFHRGQEVGLGQGVAAVTSCSTSRVPGEGSQGCSLSAAVEGGV